MRPPVDPPRRLNQPDPPGKVRILWECVPTCFWHDGCQKIHSAPMKIVRSEPDYDVLECCACEKRGRYPVGGSGIVNCDEESRDAQ